MVLFLMAPTQKNFVGCVEVYRYGENLLTRIGAKTGHNYRTPGGYGCPSLIRGLLKKAVLTYSAYAPRVTMAAALPREWRVSRRAGRAANLGFF
jgi:hypothetical protein